jgi:hypothetical protein
MASATTDRSEENMGGLLSDFKSLHSKNIAVEEMQCISELLLNQRDATWGDLLSAAPRTLCSIGQCFVIASSEGTEGVVQKRDSTMYVAFVDFFYGNLTAPLSRPQDLRTNLVNCLAQAREAFREAENRMSRVSVTIGNIIEFDGVV